MSPDPTTPAPDPTHLPDLTDLAGRLVRLRVDTAAVVAEARTVIRQSRAAIRQSREAVARARRGPEPAP